MKMDGNIRVRTDSRYKVLYNDLKNNSFGDMHEIFFLCVCLGYREKEKITIEKSDDRFWSKTITPEEWSCYYSIVLEEHNMDFSTIQNDENIIRIMEQYANGGMKILINGVISNFVIKNKDNGIYSIDSSSSKELPKIILHYIYENI